MSTMYPPQTEESNRGGSQDAASTSALRRWRCTCLALFLLAFSVRWYTAAFYAREPSADAAHYHRLAANLSQGLGFVSETGTPTAWRPPAYPAFLAAAYSVVGVNLFAATLVQAVVGALTVLLLARLGALAIGLHEGIVAGTIAAIYPGLFWLPRQLLSENLSLFLILAALCAAVLLARTGGRSPWWALPLGLLIGLSALVRGANLLIAPLILLGATFGMRREKHTWKSIFVSLTIVIGSLSMVVLPWTARNYSLFGQLVPVATQDGIGLYASYWPPHPAGKRIWGTLPGDEDPVAAAASRAGDEAAVSKHFQRVTVQRLLADPLHLVKQIPEKLVMLAVPLDWEIFPHVRSLNYGYLLLIMPALFGLWSLFKHPSRPPHQWVLWILPVAVLLQTVVFYGSPRMRIPAELSLIVWASSGAVWIWLRLMAAVGARKSLANGRQQ